MTSAHARIAVATSFIVMSTVGAGLVFAYWYSQNSVVAAGRAVFFIVIMACVHLAGYLLFVQQDFANPVESAAPRGSFEISPLYWHALKTAVLLQLFFGALTSLMLDLGRSFGFFQVALLGHWIGILLIITRRPLSATKIDIFFIRWGIVLLLIMARLIAPLVWAIIGESDLSGWQRLWG